MFTLDAIKIIEIPKIEDVRGNISVIEGDTLPYEINRVYYLYDVPCSATRGGHAHIAFQQCLIALSGSFDVVLNDGQSQTKITLNKPNLGLFIPNGIWREIENFSSGAVCLALVSDVYKEDDYIRDFDRFKDFKFSK
jgi:dTDP-4-dehydrorhamnose 3,5-epimerase-like enzyme